MSKTLKIIISCIIAIAICIGVISTPIILANSGKHDDPPLLDQTTGDDTNNTQEDNGGDDDISGNFPDPNNPQNQSGNGNNSNSTTETTDTLVFTAQIDQTAFIPPPGIVWNISASSQVLWASVTVKVKPNGSNLLTTYGNGVLENGPQLVTTQNPLPEIYLIYLSKEYKLNFVQHGD